MPQTERRSPRSLLAPSILAGLVLISMGASLGGAFVWDDGPLIVDNRVIKSPGAIGEILTSGFWETGDRHDRFRAFFRPLVSLSYMADYAVWGLRPVGFHLTNLLLHFACCLLVWRIALLEKLGAGAALAGAALFAVHPVHVETVAWIAGRTDLVCGMFMLGAFVLYRRGRLGNQGWARFTAPALFALALFSKEMAATLPALVFADRWWDGERRGRLRAAATATAPFLLVLALYLVARNTVLGPPGPALYTLTPVEHAATALFVLARYATLLLIPLGLDAHYPYQPVAGLFAPLALFGAVMLVTVLGLAVRFARLQPRVALWTAWILVGLTPVMGFGRFGDVLLADRFLYLPSVGLALLAAWAFRSLAGSAPSLQSARAPVAGAVALILLFAGLSAARVRVWRDDLTLFTEMARTSPDSPLVRTNLGLARYGRGEYHTAIEEFRHALHVTPDYALARNNLAAALEREGRLHEAFVEYQAALRHAPGLAEARANAAILEVRLGRPQDGLGRLRRLVREQGDYLPGRYALAFTLNELGRNDEAFREAEWVLARDADYTQAYYLAGKIRFEQERLDEAAGFMRQFLDRWREDDPFTAAARRIITEAEAEAEAPGGARS